MVKLFIEDLSVKGKKILMRVDFNVPLDNQLNVSDATRIEAAIPSILYVLKNGGALILMSHLGRPKGEPKASFSLRPVAQTLSQLLDYPVKFVKDCLGNQAVEEAGLLKPGEILLLENLRFHIAEEHPEKDPTFAQKLATLGELYVNDAFGTSHRKHSSTYTITRYFPGKAAAGYLLEKEIRFLGNALNKPERPFIAVIGGAKISTKIGVIQSLLDRVDRLLIGGGMAFPFLKANHFEIGASLAEPEHLPVAKNLMEKYSNKIVLPIDCVAARELEPNTPRLTIKLSEGIPDDYKGFDIGPETLHLFKDALALAKTVLWNGPLGAFECHPFGHGTAAIAAYLAHLSKAKTIIGGGDLAAAIKKTGVAEKLAHISTGGGATLEYIEHGTLPGIDALSDKK